MDGLIRTTAARDDIVSRYNVIEIACCLILLVFFCARFWGLGISNTDDGLWALWGHQADKHPILQFARDQGRLWGFGGGGWIALGLWFADSWVGDSLIVASFVLFFALFLRAAAAYWSRDIAFAAAGIFLALFAFRADRSILYSYPLFFWVPASAVLAAILLARRYQRHGGTLTLGASGLLLLVGLFNNEGAIVLSLAAYAAALIANYLTARERNGARTDIAKRRGRSNLIVYAVIGLGFGAASVAWRLLHPSTYSGITLAPLDARKIIETLFSFSTSGTILYDLVHPYAQTFSDTLLPRVVKNVYEPRRYLAAAAVDPVSLTAGLAAALLMARTLSRQVAASPLRPSTLGWGVLVGLVAATLPLLPVAMTTQYQSWFYLYDAHAYSHTVFANFGLALAAACLAGLVMTLRRIGGGVRYVAGLLISLGLGGFAMVGNQMNDAIARDFRPEGARWRMLGHVVRMEAATGAAETAYVPRLRNGSWFAVMPPDYWSDYARDVFRSRLRISDRGLSVADLSRGADYADYQIERNGRHFAVTLAHVPPTAATAQPLADRMTVLIEGPITPATGNRILAFDDLRDGPRQIPLREMMSVGRGMWTLAGLQALPTSARLVDEATISSLVIGCGPSAPLRVSLVAASAMPAGRGCLAADYLTRGWGPPEAGGTWTNGALATIDIPLDGPVPADMRLQFDASSYTGLGYYAGAQTVRLTLHGRLAATWEFRPGRGPLPPVAVVASDWTAVPQPGGGERHVLTLEFAIDPPYQPKRLGLAPDERELGLLLRSITLDPAQ